jgi:ABC-type nitrate/sulfonate/bicarbonate transport system ATPase subunit
LDEALLLANNIYIMSKRPMHTIDTFNIKSSQIKRIAYDEDLMKIKKQIFQTITK